jgi:hypothetical protein
MAQGYIHYLFGELRQVNESRVVPAEAVAVKAWLDAWLPHWVESAEEAEPDFERVRERCRAWQSGDWRDEVGVISLPLTETPDVGGVRYVHLICRVYFNWASGGRVSRTGHAVLLTAEQWQSLAHNPFRLPHLVRNAGAFSSAESPDFARFGADDQEINATSTQERLGRLEEPSRLQLKEIWQGAPPVRLPADAPLQLYELLLLSLPLGRRATTSCVCGPFGLKRGLLEAIDIAPGPALSVSRCDLARPSLCANGLDAAESIDGCWDVTWVRRPLVAPLRDAPPRHEPIIRINFPSTSRVWVNVGAVLMIGAILLLALPMHASKQIEKACMAWSRDFNDLEKRFDETRSLLQEANKLLKRDPNEHVCTNLNSRVRALADLYRSRLAEIDGLPASDKADVERLNALNADLSALTDLTHVSKSIDGDRLFSAPDQLYRAVADWVGAAQTARDLRERYDWLRRDEAERGLPANPHLTGIEAQVRALEQQEAVEELRTAATSVGPVDTAGLAGVRDLYDGFRARYPGERNDELAAIASEAAMRFESGARPPLEAAYDALQQQPTRENLDALKQAVAVYDGTTAPAVALSERAGINGETLLEQLETARLVKVSVTRIPMGARAEVGALAKSGACEPRDRFAPFGGEEVCVQLIRAAPMMRPPQSPSDTPPEAAPNEGSFADGVNALFNLLDAFRPGRSGANGSTDLYAVRLLELLQAGTWRSLDGAVALRAELEWPRLDAYHR